MLELSHNGPLLGKDNLCHFFAEQEFYPTSTPFRRSCQVRRIHNPCRRSARASHCAPRAARAFAEILRDITARPRRHDGLQSHGFYFLRQKHEEPRIVRVKRNGNDKPVSISAHVLHFAASGKFIDGGNLLSGIAKMDCPRMSHCRLRGSIRLCPSSARKTSQGAMLCPA